jgi:predicted CoA-binding protein
MTLPKNLFIIKKLLEEHLKKEKVAILGASEDKNRYSHICMVTLLTYGHSPILVNPNRTEIDGIKCYPTLSDIPDQVDTLTVYVNPKISSKIKDEITSFKCKRIIFNPGSENPSLYEPLRKNFVEVIEACTLVMLRSDQF